MFITIVLLLALFAALYLTFEWSMFVPAGGNVAVLMYHKVTLSHNDSISITAEYLRRQFEYIKNSPYKVVSLSELMKIEADGKNISDKYLLLTFDDGYKNNQDLLLPLLEEYKFPAAIFLTVGNIAGENEWDGGGEKLLSYENIREMAANKYVEFGLHSYLHQSYAELNADEAAQDIDNCFTALKQNHIPFIPVLAYPYGAYPKKDKIKKEQLFDILQKRGIKYALRIGNGLNRLPFKNPLEIKRVNVRGSDSFLKFKVKLRKGHVKLFE